MRLVENDVLLLETTIILYTIARTQPIYTDKCIYTGLMLINYILRPCEDIST